MANLLDFSGLDLSGLNLPGTSSGVGSPQGFDEILASLGEDSTDYRSGVQDAKFRRALRQVDSTDALLQQLGEAPVPAPTPPLIFQAMDALDTPRQYIAGAASKLLGVDGYGDLNFQDAASKAAQNNLTTADILEKTFLPGKYFRGPRAAIGFAGDVLTDPVTYLSFGTGGMAKAGGRAITKAGEKVVGKLETMAVKEALESVAGIAPALHDSTNAFRDVVKASMESLGKDVHSNPKVMNAVGEALFNADAPIGEASNLLKQIKGAKRSGAWDTSPEFRAATMARVQEVEQKIGAPIEQLFAPNAIRITNPLGSQVWDIPGVTPASAKAFEAIGDVFAKGKAITSNTLDSIDKGLKATGMPSAKLFSEAIDVVRKFPKLVSRAKAAGSAHAAGIIGSAEMSRAVAHGKSQTETDVFLTPLTLLAKEHQVDPNDLFEDFGRAMAAAGDEARRLKRVNAKLGTAPSLVEGGDEVTNLFHQILNKKSTELSEKYSPQLGNQFRDSVLAARNEWAQMAAKEEADGTLGHVIEEYFTQMYQVKPGLNPVAIDRSITGEFARGGAAKFSMERVFTSLAEAQSQGLTPNFNIRDVFSMRLTQHKIAEANKIQLHRLALETGLDKTQYFALQAALASPNPETAANAKMLAQHLGFSMQDDMMRMSVAEQVNKMLPSPQIAERANALKELATTDLAEAEKQAKKARVAAIKAAARSEKAILTGKKADIRAARAAEADVAERLATEAEQLVFSKRSEHEAATRYAEEAASGVKTFFRPDGSIVTPEHYEAMRQATDAVRRGREIADWHVDFAAEAKQMGFKFESPHELLALERANQIFQRTNLSNIMRGHRDVTSDLALAHVGDRTKGLIKGGLKNPDNAWLDNYLPTSVVRVLDESVEGLDKIKAAANRYKKEGGLGSRYGDVLDNMASVWTGWTKALKWGFTQPFLAFTGRNAASMPFMMAKDISLLGEALNPHAIGSFMKVMNGAADFRNDVGRVVPHWQFRSALAAGNLNVTTEQMIDAADAMTDVMRTYQRTSKLDDVMRGVMKGQVGGAGAKIVGAINRMNEAVENTGRSLLAFNLHKKGYSMGEAIKTANDTMINYATGKTPFERTYLNNMLLFYSFTRHQTANSLTALVTKPGAITGQKHFRDALSYALTQEDAPPLPAELNEVVRTVKSKDSLSSYVGRSTEGLPLIMSQVGLPIEDLARYTNPRAPRDYSYRGIMEAAGLTARDTLRMVGSQMHPAYKSLIEIASGKNLYFDRPLTDKSVRTFRSLAPIAEKLMGFDPNSIPSHVIKTLEQGPLALLGARDNGDGTYAVNPYLMTAATSWIPLLGRSMSTVNSLADATVDGKYSLLKATTGIKVSPVDLESSAIFDRKMKQIEMLELSGLPTSKRDLIKRIQKERAAAEEE